MLIILVRMAVGALLAVALVLSLTNAYPQPLGRDLIGADRGASEPTLRPASRPISIAAAAISI